MRDNVYFTSQLSLSEVAKRLEAIFKCLSDDMDDHPAKYFILFGFYSLGILQSKSRTGKPGYIYVMSQAYVPNKESFDLEQQGEIFNNYFRSIIRNQGLGVPVNGKEEELETAKLTKLTGKAVFTCEKEIDVVVNRLEKILVDRFVKHDGVYRLETFGLTLQLHRTGHVGSKREYAMMIERTNVFSEEDCIEGDISPYLQDLVADSGKW